MADSPSDTKADEPSEDVESPEDKARKLKRESLSRALAESRIDEAVLKLADELGNAQDAKCEDKLIAAEVKIAAKQSPLQLLVEAGKLDVHCDRAFFLLGKLLKAKNPAKAKALFERSVKLAPSNAEYVRELDDLLVSKGASALERLPYLETLSEVHRTEWLTERLARLYLATNNYIKAINKLQLLTTQNPNCMQRWGLLAYAYQQNGHLKAAAESYKKILTADPDSHHAISLIRVLMLLKDYEKALEQCAIWKAKHQDHSEANIVVDLLEIQINARQYAGVKSAEEKQLILKNIFHLLWNVISEKPPYSLAYKLAGDALLKASVFNAGFIKSLEINPSWDVTCRVSAARQASFYYLAALKINHNSVLSWYDLAIALLRQFKLENNKEFAEKSALCLKTAIGMSKNSAEKSKLWTVLFEALRYSGSSDAVQHHCLCRALQLNKKNAAALVRLAIFYFVHNKPQSHQCFERALTFDPYNSPAWCAWAEHARQNNAFYEAESLTRQALTFKPNSLAVRLFCIYTIYNIHNGKPFDMLTGIQDFPSILAVRDIVDPGDLTLVHLGVLADLHGYYEEAVELLEAAQNTVADIHLKRVKIKLGLNIGPQPPKGLGKLFKWSEMPIEMLNYELQTNKQIYPDVFDYLMTGDAEKLKEKFVMHYKKLCMPLIVAENIVFQRPLPDNCVLVLHDLVPRHELIDFFPTLLPANIDNGLRCVEKDEAEKPFRYSHRYAKVRLLFYMCSFVIEFFRIFLEEHFCQILNFLIKF
ncbi:hypothetical protein WR25_10583 isoform A [Diploscapter pachys]|uniref:Tetratricopeptide repeat protein n=1 Tax=Diploscapter pachys TaxID=2018661 RepID=A0A2A2JFA0_9BILA|nr:hypothetical protein WR25_10583 isoform A [Diploscapter pachys]